VTPAPPGADGRTGTVKVALLAFPQVDELDLFGAHAVISKAASVDPRGLEVYVAARQQEVTTSGGLVFHATEPLEAVHCADAVVVPGGGGARCAAADVELLDALRTAADRGARIYGVCSGTLVIAAAGLAKAKRVAFHHGKHELLLQYPVGSVEAGLVRDGDLCTVGGDLRESVKAVDVAFALLSDLAPDAVGAISARMELSPGRGVTLPAEFAA
jgi:transcriptional regulator GlxA family with amidase domain